MFFAIIIARVLQYEVCVELCQKRQMEVQCKIKKMQTYFNEICICLLYTSLQNGSGAPGQCGDGSGYDYIG